MTWLEEFHVATEEMRSSETYFRWVGLSILASTIGRKVWLNFNGTPIYPNLYILLVGTAALTNKSTAAQYAQKLLKGVPNVRVLPENMTAAALLNRMAANSTTTHVTVGNFSYPYGGNLIYATEAINVLGRSKWGNMTDLLTELYDNYPYGWNMDDPWTKETLQGGQVKIYNQCINLLGCTTPEGLLSKIVHKNEIDSGFASRVCFVYEESGSNKSYTWLSDENAELNEARLSALRNRLIEINKLSGAVRVSPDVMSRHVAFMSENEAYVKRLGTHKLKSFYGRKGTHILKLAMILSISESNKLEVNMTHWNLAHEYISGIETKYKKLFMGVGNNRYAGIVSTVWEYLEHNESFTMSELTNELWEDFDADTIRNGVQTLITMKRIVLVEGRFVAIDKSPLT